jgi:hypothetical protein
LRDAAKETDITGVPALPFVIYTTEKDQDLPFCEESLKS